MKFGKRLLTESYPPWSRHYLNYKHLKKVIKNNPRAEPSPFFFELDRDLEKVTAFYLRKVAELKDRLERLKRRSAVYTKALQKNKMATETLIASFKAFLNEIGILQEFVSLNSTGFRKILKKHDKNLQLQTQELYLSSKVAVQPFTLDAKELAQMQDGARNMLDVLSKSAADAASVIPPSLSESDRYGQLIERVTARDLNGTSSILAIMKADLTKSDTMWTKEAIELWTVPALLRACDMGHTEIICAILDSELADIDSADPVDHGRSGLHKASKNGNLATVELLLKRGADPVLLDAHGRTSLHYAAIGGNVDVIEKLLELKIDTTIPDSEGYLVIFYVVAQNSLSCVAKFLDGGVPINQPCNLAGMSPLTVACSYGHTDMAKLLLVRGADQTVCDEDHLSPLHVAARAGHSACVRVLLESGCNVNVVQPSTKRTPLFEAASEGNLECVRILLEYKAVHWSPDAAGWLPHVHALFRGHVDVVQLLRSLPTPQLSEDLVQSAAIDELEAKKKVTNTAPPSAGADDTSIPPFELPPPAVPFRHYGHSYLKETQLRIRLGHTTQIRQGGASAGHMQGQEVQPPALGRSSLATFLPLKNEFLSMRLMVSLQANPGEQQMVMLPIDLEEEPLIFTAGCGDDFSLQIELHPAFESQQSGIIGKGVLPPASFEDQSGVVSCAIIGKDLSFVCEILLTYLVISPLNRTLPETNTYWKSTQVLEKAFLPLLESASGNGFYSVIADTSLDSAYVIVGVQVTSDGVVVAHRGQDITVDIAGSKLRLPISSVTAEQFTNILSSQNRSDSPTVYSLESALNTVPEHIGFNISIKTGDETEANKKGLNMLVDSVLSTLYRHVGRRPIMLSSESRDVCIMMSLKQPKFPVFFVSTAKDSQSSIQGSLKFCNEHLLLGMFIPHWILEDAPVLPKAIQESGLVVIACNRENSGQLIPCDQASATKDLVDGTCNTGVVFVNTKSVSHNPDEYFAWARRFHEYQVETLEGSRLPDVNNICISQSAIDPPRTGDMAATKDSSMLTSHSEPRGNSNLDPLAFSLTDAKPMSNSILNGESVIQNRNPASILDFLRK